MGRVRKYKKIKAIDPFSKRGKDTVGKWSSYDEPPSLYNDKKKKKKKSNTIEDNDDLLIQREGLRALRDEKRYPNMTQKKTEIEGKRNDENMRDFKIRIREETKNILIDELKGMTATAKKKKLRLAERKKKKKTSKLKGNNEDQIEFFQASNGKIRPSDLGAPTSFRTSDEELAFGVVNDAPPVLSVYPKLKSKSITKQNDTENITTNDAPHNKKLKLESIWNSNDEYKQRSVNELNSKDSTNKTNISKVDLEKVRLEAQEAYKKLKAVRTAAFNAKTKSVY
jgi:hypothetical protein